MVLYEFKKFGHAFRLGLKIKVIKKQFLQKCASKLLFFIERKIRRISMILDIIISL